VRAERIQFADAEMGAQFLAKFAILLISIRIAESSLDELSSLAGREDIPLIVWDVPSISTEVGFIHEAGSLSENFSRRGSYFDLS